jgi:hypothetical protein
MPPLSLARRALGSRSAHFSTPDHLIKAERKAIKPDREKQRSGGRGRTRTRNILVRSQTLYPLSYAPKMRSAVSGAPPSSVTPIGLSSAGVTERLYSTRRTWKKALSHSPSKGDF